MTASTRAAAFRVVAKAGILPRSRLDRRHEPGLHRSENGPRSRFPGRRDMEARRRGRIESHRVTLTVTLSYVKIEPSLATARST